MHETSNPGIGELAYIIVDCQDNERVATFWSAVLGLAIADNPSPPYIDLVRATEDTPVISFQQVAEGKVAKNRLHMDIRVSNLAEASDQIVALGGSLLQVCVEDPYEWRVMADPENNEFCIVLS